MGKSSKAAQTKQFFPSISDRLKSKIDVTSNFTAMLTGHGKTRAYLHRFKLLESATCPCNKGGQTTDHLLYHYTLLQHQREILKKETLKYGNWPISKHDLITKHLKSFFKFTNSIEFDKLQREKCNRKELRVYHTMVIHCKGNAATGVQSRGRPCIPYQ